jgi:two-component system, NtrC family, sensor histidine kinase HydH
VKNAAGLLYYEEPRPALPESLTVSLHHYPTRFLVVTAASSFLLLGLTVAVGVYLNAERARTAAALGENLGSRRAAAGLEETLTDLLALRSQGVTDVQPLHERAAALLSEIQLYADKEDERDSARRIEKSFNRYLQIQDPGLATAQLRDETLPASRRLREFNTQQVLDSDRAHQVSLELLAWGFVAVGSLGSVAGLLLGYGLARGLRRAVDSLLVQVQGASDLLGQELATVRVDPAGPGIENLVERVGEVVRVLQQREREVRRAERLAAVGQLAAGVAHEIRNPLTSVQLLVQTARKDPAAALDSNDLALIDSELGRIEESLRIFLDYARPSKPLRESCDLAIIVRDTLNLTRTRAEQQQIEVRFAAPGPVMLFADPRQLRQVAMNLVLNALDAMPQRGSLEVAAVSSEDQVQLVVTDSGKGIPPEILPRLFEPFATDKETGLGLGLVVSKRIVEDHGGTIAGINRPCGGAQFTVRLPR